MKTAKTLLAEKLHTLIAEDNKSPDSGTGENLICKITNILDTEKQLMEEGKENTPMEREKLDAMVDRTDPYEDERVEVNEILARIKGVNDGRDTFTSKKLGRNADSIVLVVRKSDLKDYQGNPDSAVYELRSKDLKSRRAVVGSRWVSFDPNLKKAGQRSAYSLGTGFFYEEKYIVTAAHVLFPAFAKLPLSEVRFVRGFAVRQEKNEQGGAHAFDHIITIQKREVYQPVKRLLEAKKDYRMSSNGLDWAVVEVEPEDGRQEFSPSDGTHATLRKSDLVTYPQEQEIREVYGLGHGFGMPLKISPCGEILDTEQFDNPKEAFFNCKLDFFSGNSGSPVFDAISHKLVGMLVRGQRDIFLSDTDDQKVVPGVLATADDAGGEECLKMDFLVQWQEDQDKNVTSRDLISSNGAGLDQAGILPYTLLKRAENGTYHLFLCLENDQRKVFFPESPVKRDATTVIECYLDEKDTVKKFFTHRYRINGPAEDLDQTDETIEIRVFDLISGISHITILEYQNSIPVHGALEDGDRPLEELYWGSCLTEKFFQQNSERTVGISLGYFEREDNFIRSAITDLNLKDLNDVGLKFNGANQAVVEVRPLPVPVKPADKILVISETGQFAHIRKGTSLGGRNPKPTRFVDIEDIIAAP